MGDASIWESGVVGPPGPPGQPALLRLLGDWIQWSVSGTDIWTNLVPLSSITGEQGPPGLSVQGPPGPPGESVQGIQGLPGNPGTPGLNGSTIYAGSGAPSNALGVNGDYYIDRVNQLFYGPKASGTWAGVPTFLIKGDQGIQGVPGNTGPAGIAQLPTYTLTTLPSASANVRNIVWCSNLTGGAEPVVSNGTTWQRLSDKSIAN